MLGNRQVYCSVDKIAEAIPHLVDARLGIEVVFDSTDSLWPQVRWEDILEKADSIAKAGLRATVHGPFHGINMGSRDNHIREFSESVLTSCIEACTSFQSPLMVFHTGFISQLAPKSRVKWLENLLPGLERLLESARKHEVFLAMENTYEEDTEIFEEIFTRVQHPHLRMCLDTGHATCFGKIEPRKWAEVFSDRISHVHLSDNDGKADLHWTLGKGKVDFLSIIRPLFKSPHNVTITYEVAGPDVVESRDYFEKLTMNLAE
jgi:sugar phosphate isomerase/epimerase